MCPHYLCATLPAEALPMTGNALSGCCLRPCSAARREAAERTLCHSLQLAAACGLVAGGVLLAGGPTFFSSMGTAPELMVPAGQYLSIRQGLAMPAADRCRCCTCCHSRSCHRMPAS
jgi:Na+-driven multidrug efflux pump